MASRKKNVVLIAHDNLKADMVDWGRAHLKQLQSFELFATGTTGGRLESELGLSIVKFKSGPFGGDLQIGSRICEGAVDLLIFFWDPLAPHPHDVDVKALLRIAAVYNVPIACNRSSADLMMVAFES